MVNVRSWRTLTNKPVHNSCNFTTLLCADIRRSKIKTTSKFTVKRSEPFNFQSISASNNCSWRRVKAFKSRIEQKPVLRNAVQMYVENEFFMFLSLLFCNNESTAAPFINFLSRHHTFVEFLISLRSVEGFHFFSAVTTDL